MPFYTNRNICPAHHTRNARVIPNTFAQAMAPGNVRPYIRKPDIDEPTDIELLEGEIAIMRDELDDYSDPTNGEALGLRARLLGLEAELDALRASR